MLLHMYEVFVFLLVHLQFFAYFFSTFMENLFKNHPIFSILYPFFFFWGGGGEMNLIF